MESGCVQLQRQAHEIVRMLHIWQACLANATLGRPPATHTPSALAYACRDPARLPSADALRDGPCGDTALVLPPRPPGAVCAESDVSTRT